MAIPINPQYLTNVIAYNGDKVEIPNDTQPDSGQPSIASGWPRITSLPVTAGGVAPSREGFNGLFNLLSQHTFFQQSGGLYSWSNSLSYPVGSVIRASNGGVYLATANNGVDYSGVGAKDPISSPTFWSPLLINGVAPLSAGGTGAATATQARNNLGLGSAATQNVGTSSGQVPTYGEGQVLDGNVSGTAKTITDILGVKGGGTGTDNVRDFVKTFQTIDNAANYGNTIDFYGINTAFMGVPYLDKNMTTAEYAAKIPTQCSFYFSYHSNTASAVQLTDIPVDICNVHVLKGADGNFAHITCYGVYNTRDIWVWSGSIIGTKWVKVFNGDNLIPIQNGGTGQGSIPAFVKIASAASGNITIPAGGTWYCLVFSAGTNGIPAFSHTGGGGTQIPNSGAYLVHSYAICFRIA